jgi:WD40 repeat protein
MTTKWLNLFSIRAAVVACWLGAPIAIADSAPNIVWMAGGHIGVLAVAVSPDDQWIATGGSDSDQTIKIWRRSDGALVKTLTGNAGGIGAIAFSPDGQFMATGCTTSSGEGDSFVKLRSFPAGAIVGNFEGHFNQAASVAFSPDGTRLVSGSFDATAIIWDVPNGGILQTLSGHADAVNDATFSPDGMLVATASNDHTAIIWDAATGTPLHTLSDHTFFVSAASFSADGSTLATGGWDSTVKQWNVSTGSLIRTITGSDTAYDARYSPDGSIVAAGFGDVLGEFNLYNASTGAFLRPVTGHSASITALAFDSTGTTVVSGSFDSTAVVSDVATGSVERILGKHHGQVQGVAYAPSGQFVVSCAADLTIRLWNAADGAELRVLTGHQALINDVAVSADSSKIASAAGELTQISIDSTVRIWNAADGSVLQTLAGHNRGSSSVAFSPDGTKIVTGGQDRIGSPVRNRATVKLWDATTGQLLQTLYQGASGSLTYAVAFTPDGAAVASGGTEGVVLIHEIATGAQQHALAQGGTVVQISFAADGANLATTSQETGTVQLWRVADETLLHTLQASSSFVQAAILSPDGQTVIGGSGFDHVIRVWRASDGMEQHFYDAETGWGTEPQLPMAFSPDGTKFVYGRSDATVVLARIESGCPQIPGDSDCDGDVDLIDWAAFAECMTGPGSGSISAGCDVFDFETDADVDLGDAAVFMRGFAQ